MESRKQSFPYSQVSVNLERIQLLEPHRNHYTLTVNVGIERVATHSQSEDMKEYITGEYWRLVELFCDGDEIVEQSIKPRVFHGKSVEVVLDRIETPMEMDGKKWTNISYAVIIYIEREQVRRMVYCEGRERQALDDYNTIVGAFMEEEQ